MLKAARHKEIATLVHSGGAVEVNALAQRFQTSPITIRRDLIELEEKGLLSRTRGGAVSGGEVIAEGWARYESITYAERERENWRQKRAIGELAAQLVTDGDCILINGGTSSRNLAEALRGHRNLHVVTNGLTVAMELARSEAANVYLLPGHLDFRKMTAVAPLGVGVVDDLSVRAAFLGVHGISATGGIAMLTPEEAALNRTFMEVAQEVNVLVDSSKFSAQGIFRIAQLNKVSRVITDWGVKAADREALEAMNVQVLVANDE